MTLLENAINSVRESQKAFCRYITANDVGSTGSHQSGFYIPKGAYSLLFDNPGTKGNNMDRQIRIEWPEGLITNSRAIYYGNGTRNEYRLTRFGRGFPFLQEKYSGSLLILAHVDSEYYQGYVLESDDDIEDFLAEFNISPLNMESLISVNVDKSDRIGFCIEELVNLFREMPTTKEMSRFAREIYSNVYKSSSPASINHYDNLLINWLYTEYLLFQAFEDREFELSRQELTKDKLSVLDYTKSLLNRRKSRAGKSLEHHLAHIFTESKLRFESQAITEGKKKPDFIFPDGMAYHNFQFPGELLTFLGAKTTCKDRWRQVLNEADRIPHKYLFTLQQGITTNQLEEMKKENLTLVVPRQHIQSFDKSHQKDILSLRSFIENVQAKQKLYP